MAFIMIFGLTACGQAAGSPAKSDTTTQSESESVTEPLTDSEAPAQQPEKGDTPIEIGDSLSKKTDFQAAKIGVFS